MKKLLAILGSLTLAATSSSTLIACGGMLQVRKALAPILNYFNNSQNNLVGASFQKAKSVIIDDQFGIDQTKTLEILNGFSAQENIDNYDAHDGTLSSTSILKDVMGKYLGTNTVDNGAVMGKNVHLGGHLGTESGLESLLPAQFKPYLRQFLSWIKSGNLVNSPFWNMQDLNRTLTNVDDIFKSGGEGVNLILDQLIKLINNQFNIDLKSVLTTWLPKIINTINGVMNGDKISQLRSLLPNINALYQQALSTALQDISAANLTFKDLNQKLFSLMVQILEQVVVLTPDANLDNLGTGLDDEEKFLTTFLNQLIKGQSLTTVDLSNPTTWAGLLKPVFEFIIISNVYFQQFDSLKSYQVVDHQHLFSASEDNYTFLSELKDVKVSDSVVFKDQGVNLNYFVANLNYFLGSLQNFDQTSEYRLEQLLFLLFNDASNPSQNGDPYYFDKESSTLTHLFNVGLGLGYLNNLVPEAILTIMQTPSLKTTIFNTLKPIFLGFINGDDASGLINLVNNVLPLLPTLIPGLNQFPLNQIFDILQLMVKNLARYPDASKNMFHFLFSGDGNKLFQGVELPESLQKVLGNLFGSGEKNFLTLLNKPLFEILSLFGVKGFEQGTINPIGDNYTLKSLPQLFGLLNNYLNHLNPSGSKNANLYVDSANADNSLQNFNKKDIKVEVDLLQRLIGKDTGENNLISQVLIKLFGLNPDGSGTLTLDVPDALEYLGFLGNDTYQLDSFLGDFVQLSLPNLVKAISSGAVNGQIQLSDANVSHYDLYGIDLYQLFAKDLLDIFNKFSNPADYSVLISQLLTTKNTYELVYDPKKLTYFSNTGKVLIKGFSYQVIFTNPLNNVKTTYWFEISRNSNTEVFHFDSIINDRILNS